VERNLARVVRSEREARIPDPYAGLGVDGAKEFPYVALLPREMGVMGSPALAREQRNSMKLGRRVKPKWLQK